MGKIYGADVCTLVSVDGWRALRSGRSASFGIVRCYRSTGEVDPNAATSIKSAHEAGFSWVDIYHFPSFLVDAAKQIDASLDAISRAGARFNRCWFDVEDGAHWSNEPSRNVDFLRQLIAAAEARGIEVGIHTALNSWATIMNNSQAFAKQLLWYAHYDGNANYNDFPTYGPRGGWAAPAMKQFKGNEKWAGVSYDGNVCPDDSPAVPGTTPPPPQKGNRALVVQCAESVIGLCANPANPISREKYIELIAPGETPAAQAEMAAMSGCGLTVAGIWRKAGLHDRSLDAPYKIGTAISRLMVIAHEHGAWVHYRSDAAPSPGDMVLLEGPEHVFTVTQIHASGEGYSLTSVDGGERDSEHFELIRHMSRRWSGGHDDNGLSRRRIIGWIDVSKFPFSKGSSARA